MFGSFWISRFSTDFSSPPLPHPRGKASKVPSSDGNGAATRDDTALPLTSSLKGRYENSKYLKSTYLND